MAIKLEDVLNANLVLVGVELLNDQGKFEQFRNEFAPDLRFEGGLITNGLTGVTEQSRTLILSRDRIQFTLHASRSTINREYPEETGLAKLARSAALAINFTDVAVGSLQAFGYNMELVFDQDSMQSARQYIGSRLFNRLPVANPGWDCVGGTGRMIFSDGADQWTISAEPRYGDDRTSRLFLSVNLHKHEQRFPSEDEILTSLEKIQCETLAFMSFLDEGAVC